MFSSGSTTAANTSLFGQATPINQNRTGTSLLFGNSTTQPSALTSTPLSSSNVFGASTPLSTPFQTSSTVGTGTTTKFDPVISSDKITKNGTQQSIKTKLINICAMPVYEKKSMEELRLEDYNDKRKFAATNSAFPSVLGSTNLSSTATPFFSAGALTSTTKTTTNATPSLFGGLSSSTTPTLSGSLFSTPAAPVTSSSTMSFGFGSSTSTTATTSAPLTFGAAAPTSSPFTFGSNQATTAPTFSFGGATSLFPASTATATSVAPGTSFGFSLAKPASTSTFSFTPSTTTTTAASAFTLGSNPTLTSNVAPFNSTAATTTTPAFFNSQPSFDTRTHLQLFQTMLNIQPFSSEMSFLAKNIKPNIGLDRNRLRTAPETPLSNPVQSVFSPLLTKPSVLTSTTTITPPASSLSNPVLPTHAHTMPTVLLPSTSVTSTSSLGLFGKRKLADSFLDDDDDNSLMMDDGPSTSMTKLPKSHVVKRPRVLDMNRIRSVVLGGSNGNIEPSKTKDENPSETFVVKSVSTSDQLAGWKKFANYNAYLASKQAPFDSVSQPKLEKSIPVIKSNKGDQGRAFCLPRLTHTDYYTKPSIEELRHYFDEHGQCLVRQFTVGREHYGSVTFKNRQINLAGLDLNRLIEIGRRQVTVYPDDRDKPKEGEEFNCPATISLFGVYPIDRSSKDGAIEITDPARLDQMNYRNYLEEMTNKFQGHFIDYDVNTGTWQFQVDHF